MAYAKGSCNCIYGPGPNHRKGSGDCPYGGKKPKPHKDGVLRNPSPVTARKTKTGFIVSAKVATLSAAKKLAKKMGVRGA